METLNKQTLKNGEEGSMSSQVDFLVSHFPPQGRDTEQMTTAISGAKCSAALPKLNRLGSLVKMLLESAQ